MKTVVLIAYLALPYFFIPYLFTYLGALRKVGSISTEELNEDEDESEKLSETEAAQARKIAIIIFILLAMYLFAFLGVTYGLATQELIGKSSFKWLVYPLLYIIMVSSFRGGRKIIEKGYDISLSIGENVIYYLTMLGAYLVAIWAKETVPFILKWHWIY